MEKSTNFITTHHFDIDVAKEYGVEAAIVIYNLQYWIEKNKANDVNYFDGRYWTFNSNEALQTIFPYFTRRQIQRIFENLIAQGVILKGNWNKTKYDRTLWFAFVDEDRWLKPTKKEENELNLLGKSNKPNSLIDCTKRGNQNNQMGQPIPYNKPDNNIPNINTDEKQNNNIITQEPPKKPKEPYLIFGEFGNVKITETEFKKIIEKYEWYTEDAIATLDCYLETHGEKYKRHYPVFSKTNWIWPRVHNNPDCGIRPITNMVPDPTQQGGLRKETALEYYTKKYHLKGDENAGKENYLPLPDKVPTR